MTERMKGHGKQYKPPALVKLASRTLLTLTSETYIVSRLTISYCGDNYDAYR